MIDAIDSLGHEDGFLLGSQSFRVIAHYVIQSREHSKALRDLGMHGAVNVVQQVQSLVYELVAVFQVPLLDLVLPGRVEIVRVAGLSTKHLILQNVSLKSIPASEV